MKIIIIEGRYVCENCYILVNNNEAVVIDPGAGAEDIISAAQKEGAAIKYILLTHCHYDHIYGTLSLRGKTGAKLAVTDICAVNMRDSVINLTRSELDEPIEITDPDIIFTDKEETFCGMTVKALKTPGHTSCGTCFLINKCLFSGDTLFKRNVGRMDLPTGNSDELVKSLREVVYKLDDDIEVFPGHGDKTTIGYERKYNLSVKDSEYDNSEAVWF